MQSALTLLWDTRFSLVTVLLAGFGRAAAEVGAVMIVGGNIDGVTRVMTTAIALETSKGDLPLALGLGVVLLTLVLALNAGAHVIEAMGAAALWVTSRRSACLPLVRRQRRCRRAAARAIIDGVTLDDRAAVRARSSSGANGAGKSVLLRAAARPARADRRARVTLGRGRPRGRAARRWCSSGR